MIKDSKVRYGSVSKTFHWLMTVLIGWQLLKFGDRIAEGEHWVGQTLVPWHVSIGSLLLVLIVLRLAWVVSQRRHRPAQNPATARLVKAGHGLLFAGMLLMPITGMLVMLGGGYGVTAFGMEIFAEGEEVPWAASLGSLHSPLAWALTVLIIGHIAMALFHHFVQRDDTLKRVL
ncbi:cytochrome b [Halomonas sp. KAO]|uniref:cytochrome b n=1 Tax=unclassified Halomonas TaxID=2609666 RepID=UPI00189FDB78|nr:MULTISPECIES: cytochrome b [unclassified Halomonas]MBF7052440.1 cytochrome b [Halomonas sp. KAO]MDT0499826.1 cytochrome b [Halomonas sp. PAR7]MDT0510357.1 cytochrome b [Halomonas sp. LES1]MDT0589934.1 cytochrome b [Halomonas sp. PAR8]